MNVAIKTFFQFVGVQFSERISREPPRRKEAFPDQGSFQTATFSSNNAFPLQDLPSEGSAARRRTSSKSRLDPTARVTQTSGSFSASA